MLKSILRGMAGMLALGASWTAVAQDRPNILVIWGDDIGITNISAYSHGLMGYQTPNIDRIAREGIMFTDYYGEQSCTAGRSAFITGQSPMRTGLSKVGVPGADKGIRKEDPTLAWLLKDKGYMTAQFGKNHLGDRDEFLPTNHGFDEFFGNLYHLNAEEDPEDPDYPKAPGFRKRFGPRGVVHSFADGRVEDTGPLTRKRMETVDQEFVDAAKGFVDKAHKAKKPFFVWVNTTGMHFYTHPAPETKGKSGQGFYNDVMVAHDEKVGSLLDQLDQLGIADNTIVLYSTDNGVHYNTWPDAGITPFRSEKNTNWEGAYRVPAMVRWPGKIKPGVSNEIVSHLDWFPTLMATVGEGDIGKQLLKGKTVNGRNYNVHLDGYNLLPYLTGNAEKSPRNHFIYLSDTSDIVGLRREDWKVVYAEQRAKRFDVWRDQFEFLRIPKLFNLRRDPYERADEHSNAYNEWWARKLGPQSAMAATVLVPFLRSFKKFPPRQKPDTFTIDTIVEDAKIWDNVQYK
ncbi:arylsulfatase [Pseudoteredinibacter isoporae]|uniref:arylsulfatase n=1 Tax=Pseudoteredinibacter isoporae TaxID=570281 RepID=UPI00310A0ABC